MATDFLLTDHGSVALLQPVSPAAYDWINENLPGERWTFGTATVVEHRFVRDIVDGITSEGLSINN